MSSLLSNIFLETSSGGVRGVFLWLIMEAVLYNDVFLVFTSPWPGSTTSHHEMKFPSVANMCENEYIVCLF